MSKHMIGLLLIIYFITHIVGLTALPVFADEAIYIRWSQLMIEDFGRYAFFPLNDGKTPLQMWLMVPLLLIFGDPLFAGRLLSVIIGAGQVLVMIFLIRRLNGGKLAELFAALATIGLPFWFFHHRMALIDALLTFCLSLTLYGLLQLSYSGSRGKDQRMQVKGISLLSFHQTKWMVLTGISFGLALLTKIPALFFAPTFPLFVFFSLSKEDFTLKKMLERAIPIAMAGFFGLVIFFSLKLNPAFGQLFGRGGDFTYSLEEILSGRWRTSIDNIFKVGKWLGGNLSWSLLIASIWGFGFPEIRKKSVWLILFSLIFSVPLLILGKTLHPRYFLPMAIGFTLTASLALEQMWLTKQKAYKLLLGIIGLTMILFSVRFIWASWVNPDTISFVPHDREQYLEEWSSGHGILETTELVEEQAQDKRVLVLSEGYFGTLPDGLLMYFHGKNVSNIEIQGIGAPVREIPEHEKAKFDSVDVILLVVNQHRFLLEESEKTHWQLIKSFDRPRQAPSLQVYEYRGLVDNN